MSKMICNENPDRDPFDRDDRRRAFASVRGNALASDNSHRGSDPQRARAGKEAADPGPFDRPADQTDPAASPPKASSSRPIRGRATRSLSIAEREEIATIAKDKPNIDLEINFDYNSADISAKSLPSVQALGTRAHQSRPEGLDLRRRRPHRCGRRRGLQSGPVRTPRRRDQALSGRQVRHRRHRPRHRRIRQEQAQGSEPADGGSQPPRPGREHGKQDHRVEHS